MVYAISYTFDDTKLGAYISKNMKSLIRVWAEAAKGIVGMCIVL